MRIKATPDGPPGARFRIEDTHDGIVLEWVACNETPCTTPEAWRFEPGNGRYSRVLDDIPNYLYSSLAGMLAAYARQCRGLYAAGERPPQPPTVRYEPGPCEFGDYSMVKGWRLRWDPATETLTINQTWWAATWFSDRMAAMRQLLGDPLAHYGQAWCDKLALGKVKEGKPRRGAGANARVAAAIDGAVT